jgi:hypothetical protein
MRCKNSCGRHATPGQRERRRCRERREARDAERMRFAKSSRKKNNWRTSSQFAPFVNLPSINRTRS